MRVVIPEYIINKMNQNSLLIAKVTAMVVYHDPQKLDGVTEAKDLVELAKILGVPNDIHIDDAWVWLQQKYYA